MVVIYQDQNIEHSLNNSHGAGLNEEPEWSGARRSQKRWIYAYGCR